MPTSSEGSGQDTRALENNRRAIQRYEESARDYATEVDADPPVLREVGLRRMVAMLPPGGTILEVGSGTGRDADFLESLGARVRRTDATRAFLEIQGERGKHAELLNILTDDFGGPYDAILAMCVLLHIDREVTDRLLGKVAGALKPRGVFLVSVREAGETSGTSDITLWSGAEFSSRLVDAGFQVEWQTRDVDEDNHAWLIFLASAAGNTA